MSATKTLFSFDTKLSADTVEWCPLAGFENILIVGTYQVNKSDNEVFDDTQRYGRIYVFQCENSTFKVIQEIETRAILDMKWCQTQPWLGIVTSSGELCIFEIQNEPIKLTLVTSKTIDNQPVVLSLEWQNLNLVTSDSSGAITTWKYDSEGALEIVQTSKQHDFEAWICTYDSWDPNLIYSGGDDCKLKIWDLRSCNRGVVIGKNCHDAGVTSILSDQYNEHQLYSGSYDEKLRLWDKRNFKIPLETYCSGGGIWRIKQPKTKKNDENFIGLACMHNGFQLLKSTGSVNSLNKVLSYEEHDSLAYGLDFKKQADPECDSLFVASCSFYDCLLKIWEVDVTT